VRLPLLGSALTWAAYAPYIDKNSEVVTAFTVANNEAITWVQTPQNQDELYRIVGERTPLPDTVLDRKDALKHIIDVNAGLLGIGIPREGKTGRQ
jgi:ABC-type nitrate/sulfonate/bicarbonate transport system substrate-binding protein